MGAFGDFFAGDEGVEITSDILPGEEGETTVEEALDNLQAATEEGFEMTAPDGSTHPVNPTVRHYIRTSGQCRDRKGKTEDQVEVKKR